MAYRSRVFFVSLAVFALAALVPSAQVGSGSQAPTASLSGVVTDDQSLVIIGATAILTNSASAEVIGPVVTNDRGVYSFTAVPPGTWILKITMPSFRTTAVEIRLQAGVKTTQNVKLELGKIEQTVTVMAGSEIARLDTPTVSTTTTDDRAQALPQVDRHSLIYFHGETYSTFTPHRFHSTIDQPLSTFGADVDTASYANIRRFLDDGELPPPHAVRVEEMLNYFRFNYQAPRDGQPIALTTEIGACPWAPSHRLVLIGARAAIPAPREVTGRNIVLLLDVSGSMQPQERLPLIKTAMGMFVDTLKPADTLAIVTYAGTSGVALMPTPARERDTIQNAISELNANGSTNGASGITLAYQIARKAFIPGGVNRVVLATDGDFNVGMTDQRDLLALIERERDSGVFLSVLGVGSGNLKDATMEMLADHGNGNYSYLDSLQEARRVLIQLADGTLQTVAKDVKFQVEFNPAVVQAWKQLGYENRRLAAQDFNDDRKDAGDVGAGHTVTVLYEVIPTDVDRTIDERNNSGEWLTVKTRYKLPHEARSRLVTRPVRETPATDHLALASAVAEFGLILRDTPRDVKRWDALSGRVARWRAPEGQAIDVTNFRELVETARSLAKLSR